MPALKYQSENSIIPLIRTMKKACAFEFDHVLGRNNVLVQVEWLGFICKEGTKFIEGKAVRLPDVHSVSNGNGEEGGEWRTLSKDDFIVCWCVKRPWHVEKLGIYAIVDENGWPITFRQPGKKDDQAMLTRRAS